MRNRKPNECPMYKCTMEHTEPRMGDSTMRHYDREHIAARSAARTHARPSSEWTTAEADNALHDATAMFQQWGYEPEKAEEMAKTAMALVMQDPVIQELRDFGKGNA